MRFNSKWSIEEFLSARCDFYEIADHFQQWLSPPEIDYPLLVMKYENLFDNLEVLWDFLSLNASQRNCFPAKRGRVTKLETLSDSVRRGLDRVYSEAYQIYSDLPEFLLVSSNT